MAQHLALRLQKPTFKSVVKQVIRNQIVFRNESFLRLMMKEELRQVMREEFQRVVQNGFERLMRDEFQRVIQNEFERMVRPLLLQFQRPSLIPIEMFISETSLKLQFINTFSKRIYTGHPIKSKDGSPLMVELVNSNDNNRRVTNGPLSSLQVQIVALKGDFVQEDWNKNDFSTNIISLSNEKAQLLNGDVYINLKEGLGVIGKVSFNDISSRYIGKKFRLGAWVVSGPTSLNMNIKEAKSEGITVKCRRSKDYEKHHPPKPNSEVWRLVKIGKNGSFLRGLKSHGISTVKDFLRKYITDPATLNEIFNESRNNESRNNEKEKWNEILSHALECELDVNEFYIYYKDSPGFSLLLNSIYNVVAASIDGRGFLSLDQLYPFQQELVDQLKCQAYKNLNKLVPVDRRVLAAPSGPLTTSEDASHISYQLQKDQDKTDELISLDQSFPVMPNQCFRDYARQAECCAPQIETGEPSCSLQGLFEPIEFSIPQLNSPASNAFVGENIQQSLDFSPLCNTDSIQFSFSEAVGIEFELSEAVPVQYNGEPQLWSHENRLLRAPY